MLCQMAPFRGQKVVAKAKKVVKASLQPCLRSSLGNITEQPKGNHFALPSTPKQDVPRRTFNQEKGAARATTYVLNRGASKIIRWSTIGRAVLEDQR